MKTVLLNLTVAVPDGFSEADLPQVITGAINAKLVNVAVADCKVVAPEHLIVLAAITGVSAKLSKLEAFFAPAMKAKENVATMKQLAESIKKETIETIGAITVGVDPNMPWMTIPLKDGRRISVKMTDSGLRLRLRDIEGTQLDERTGISPNHLNKELVEVAAQ